MSLNLWRPPKPMSQKRDMGHPHWLSSRADWLSSQDEFFELGEDDGDSVAWCP